MTDKTLHADDATLAYIAQLEKELAAANARLAGIVETICGDMELRLSERQRSRIRALAPAGAEKVNAEERSEGTQAQTSVAPSVGPEAPSRPAVSSAPIPQPADGVVPPLPKGDE